MPSQSKRLPSPTASILLVEEYAALAAAFGAAIKRVAPAARTRVVRSLQEADAAIAETLPHLLILDADPPHRGAVGFFRRLKEIAPEMRVLVIGAETTPVASLNRPGLGAFQFIKKPFELEELGRAVRLLLERTVPETSAVPPGTLRDFDLIDLILLHSAAAATTVLTVQAPGDLGGEVHFLDGSICHAATAEHLGPEALQEIVQWGATLFGEADRPTDSPRTIPGNGKSVLEQALRAARTPATSLPAPRGETELADAAPARLKLVVIDDTEMLLIFAEEILRTVRPALEITTATSGLEGIDHVKKISPDLVLLDFSLPDVTGGEVCRQLLEDRETANTPVIMMSGHVAEMVTAAKQFENVVATIAKPFVSSALVALVERTLADLPQIAARRRKRKKAVRTPVENAEPQPSKRKPEFAKEHYHISDPETNPLDGHAEHNPSKEPDPVDLPIVSSSTAPEAAAHLGQLNTVVVNFPLQVMSIRFTPTLGIAAVRARPSLQLVSLHILEPAVAGVLTSEAPFELTRATLDPHGQIETIRLTPSREALPQLESAHDIPVQNLTLLPTGTGAAFELLPASVAPMRLQLTALFEVASVELATDFRVAHLVLKSQGARMRVSLHPDAAQTSIIFNTVQISLDGSGRIGEVLLDIAS